MNSTSPLLEYESSVWADSVAEPGVRFRIRRVSIAGKIELARKVREIGRGIEFLQAGNEAGEKLEAAVLAGEIDRAYLEWGLEEIAGLAIDGAAADARTLIERGPLGLAQEILGRIKAECALSGDERKN